MVQRFLVAYFRMLIYGQEDVCTVGALFTLSVRLGWTLILAVDVKKGILRLYPPYS